MNKMVILSAAAALVLAACATTGDLGDTQAEDDDTAALGRTSPSAESSAPDKDTSRSGDYDYDPVTSGPGEPGDTPPPADDGDSFVSSGDVPLEVGTAMADLAAHLGVSQDVIDWVSYEEVEWPDGSLGCPQPDMVYTQAIVNGSLMVFEVNGVSYEYHSGGGREPFLCLPAGSSKGDGGYGEYELPTTTIDLSK